MQARSACRHAFLEIPEHEDSDQSCPQGEDLRVTTPAVGVKKMFGAMTAEGLDFEQGGVRTERKEYDLRTKTGACGARAAKKVLARRTNVFLEKSVGFGQCWVYTRLVADSELRLVGCNL